MTSLLKREDFEILIATKNKSSLDFLEAMFPFEHYSNFNILIINQSQNCSCASSFTSVRVINSQEIGLSKSRNLAIRNASKKIVLLSDDDLIYRQGFDKYILTEFDQNKNATVITFNHLEENELEPHKSKLKSFQHNKKSIWSVSSVEIAFRLDAIKKNTIWFDELFGLGAYFETAEEYLFLKTVLQKKLQLYFNPAIILLHPAMSSGKKEGSDGLLYARAALFSKTKQQFAPIYLSKYLFFLLRKKHINWFDLIDKFKIGLMGINKFRELKRNEALQKSK